MSVSTSVVVAPRMGEPAPEEGAGSGSCVRRSLAGVRDGPEHTRSEQLRAVQVAIGALAPAANQAGAAARGAP